MRDCHDGLQEEGAPPPAKKKDIGFGDRRGGNELATIDTALFLKDDISPLCPKPVLCYTCFLQADEDPLACPYLAKEGYTGKVNTELRCVEYIIVGKDLFCEQYLD